MRRISVRPSLRPSKEKDEARGRGVLTREIKDWSRQLLGYEIGRDEFHLMPYIMFVMTDEQRVDPRRINEEERAILYKWHRADLIDGGITSGLGITKNFWDIICELVYMGYVNYKK